MSTSTTAPTSSHWTNEEVEVEKNRIALPWKVYFQSPNAAVTRYRGGREAQTTSRYFETEAQALAFAGGVKRRVMYRPGEAWRAA